MKSERSCCWISRFLVKGGRCSLKWCWCIACCITHVVRPSHSLRSTLQASEERQAGMKEGGTKGERDGSLVCRRRLQRQCRLRACV